MAGFVKWCKRAAASPAGQALSVVVYIAMLVLICLMFTGNGEFIYEGF